MDLPSVSVIIPTYNLAHYVPLAVRSALAQTHAPLEVIVVDDASSDDTAAVINAIDDRRVKYVAHQTNQYAAAARNTGLRLAKGDLVAFLDGDDLYHPDKLRVQAEFLARHPDIGLTYNHRVEIDANGQVLGTMLAPAQTTVQDLVMGFPFAPSEVVMRRSWIDAVGLFDSSYRYHGEDPDFHIRLALAGCTMAGVERVLNFRRLQEQRRFRNLEAIVVDESRARDTAFNDPRCPNEVRASRATALTELYVNWALVAFAQDDTLIGRALIERAESLDSGHSEQRRASMPASLVTYAIRASRHAGSVVRRLWAQLPEHWQAAFGAVDESAGRADAVRALRDCVWQPDAVSTGMRPPFELLDDDAARELLTELLACDELRGGAEADAALRRINHAVDGAWPDGNLRQFAAQHALNAAARHHQRGRDREALREVVRGIARNPRLIASRAFLGLGCASAVGALAHGRAPQP